MASAGSMTTSSEAHLQHLGERGRLPQALCYNNGEGIIAISLSQVSPHCCSV